MYDTARSFDRLGRVEKETDAGLGQRAGMFPDNGIVVFAGLCASVDGDVSASHVQGPRWASDLLPSVVDTSLLILPPPFLDSAAKQILDLCEACRRRDIEGNDVVRRECAFTLGSERGETVNDLLQASAESAFLPGDDANGVATRPCDVLLHPQHTILVRLGSYTIPACDAACEPGDVVKFVFAIPDWARPDTLTRHGWPAILVLLKRKPHRDALASV